MYLVSCPTSSESGTKTKSLVLVFRAESVSLSFLRMMSSKNFLGRIAESMTSPTLMGMILAPFSNNSLAWPIVRSS